MFHSYKMHIKKSDLVLEIGPGAFPYWRSDCLADKFDDSSDVDLKQFGGRKHETKGKPLFKIEDNKLPFKDKSFDYIICSHVLEHVPIKDLSILLEEMTRVSAKVFIEVPRFFFDFLYDFNVHLNLIDIVDGEIICLEKSLTSLSKMKHFTKYSFNLREKKKIIFEQLNPEIVSVAYEFSGNIPIKICKTEEEFFELVLKNINQFQHVISLWSVFGKLRQILYYFCFLRIFLFRIIWRFKKKKNKVDFKDKLV